MGQKVIAPGYALDLGSVVLREGDPVNAAQAKDAERLGVPLVETDDSKDGE